VADDIVFDLVRALGAERIGRTLPRTFPIEMWPFASMASLAVALWIDRVRSFQLYLARSCQPQLLSFPRGYPNRYSW
jgi:hypothetical protein